MIRHVFLSFSLGDEGLVNVFRGQATDRQSVLVFHDYAIKEVFESTWKTSAERLILACSVTICLIGKKTYRSKAIDWEIRKSAELGKTVMAVSIEPTVPRVPPALIDLNVQPLPWDMGRIIGELNGIGTAYGRTGIFLDCRATLSYPHTSERRHTHGEHYDS